MTDTNRKRLVAALLGAVAILGVSIIGTFIALYFLSATPTGEKLRSAIGLKDLKTITLDSTKTDRIVLEESSAVIDANKTAGPAVVSITATGKPIQDFFFGTTTTPKSSGTGFIVTSDGLIATNRHVVDGNDDFTITTPDGKSFKGDVVARDPVTDLALIKVDARGLPVADLGDSDKVQVGQWVIAIGNALGEFQNSVTVGVVSAKERKATPTDSQGKTESLDGLFQTDAAINPGNSGGPLVNLKGQVIGINTAVVNNAANIGFAIPVNELKKALESYKKNGKIIRPYLGVRYQAITKALAKTYSLPVESGALITSGNNAPAIASGSPAEKAGLKEGDIITKIDDQALTENNPLTRIIRQYSPDDKVVVTIVRDRKEMKVDLTLGSSGN